jgi:hypothetical protein
MTLEASRTRWSWLSFTVGLAGALVIVAGTWGGLAVMEARDVAEQEAFELCMLAFGYLPDMRPGTFDLDELIAAGEACTV